MNDVDIEDDGGEDIARNEKGQFRGSGNRKGRPRKRFTNPKLPAARRDAVFRVADRQIDIQVGGNAEKMTIFEACLFQLGAAGASGNRVAAKTFIDLTMEVSDTDLGRRIGSRQLIDRMNVVDEENQRLLAKTNKTSGVLEVPWDEFNKWAERRFDDGILDEKPPESG